jgi:hypothetical protein
MANRDNRFLIKRSNVAGKVPTAGQLLLGEMALNTADVKLFASGTTENSILPIGWDRISRTGDTVTGDYIFNGNITANTLTVTGETQLKGVIKNTGGDLVVGNSILPDTDAPGVNLGSSTKAFGRVYTEMIALEDAEGADRIEITAPSQTITGDIAWKWEMPYTGNTSGSLLGITQQIGTGNGNQYNSIWYSLSGVNINVTTNTAGTITLSASTGGGGGEANTMSNVGGGEPIFKQKTGVDFELRTLVAGNNITITSGATDLTIEALGGVASAITETITVGENVVAGDLVYLNTDTKYWKVSNATEATSSTELRLVNATILADASGGAIVQGRFTTTGLSSGSTYWVGASGNYTATQPTGNGDIVRYIGTAINSTELEFNPDAVYIEISSSSGPGTQPGYRAVTTSNNILVTDFTVDVTTTGDTTQTLPTAVGIVGKVFTVKNSDNTSTSTVTITTTGTELIDGLYGNGTDVTITFPQSLTLQSTGSGYIII